jgi:hypothetical protein
VYRLEKTERELNSRLQEEGRVVLQLRHEMKEQEDLLTSLEDLQADNNRLTLENNRIKVHIEVSRCFWLTSGSGVAQVIIYWIYLQ